MGGWETVLGVATAVAQVVLNLSPMPDILTAHRRREIGELAALPLVAMVVNCHFWLVYAYVVDSMFPLFATQVFGQAAAIVYNVVYYRWSTPGKRKGLRKLYAWSFAFHCALSVYTIVGVLGLTDQSDDQVAMYLGYVGVVIDVWLFGSPLATLKHVIETKSAASIPINLSVIMMFYGYLTGSTFPVGVTQGFGELAAFMYNVVYFRYSTKSQRKELHKVYAGAFALYCAITLYFVLGVTGATHQTHNEVGTWLGYVGTAISVVVFASPFVTLKRVVETKSAASIPINLSLMILVAIK
ncbi:hypothetical protein BBO99_00005080 [Phytophthora kernoviae]|uniref:MtN3-like protein n=2 Tax=Phytophthora kernoviae TaxID=325452 RepID=A0A3R7HIC0_9STRA|nr:hypothetical protein G195_005539 [Phytophthora kernoviae 00238/432]KAG2525382.1 hypothetical protein JM18_004402 [Phytophthora kernoviae]RLN21426.1 hypothetical protein BBI17_005167 [Phytophthora kernoviae]RLN79679.1 hypothetical protein BBO99_00005080 [Phytophthora kernoviae]